MIGVAGSCHCGNIRVEFNLARAPETYNVRVCDCEFCRRHSPAYVSDQQGFLVVNISDIGRTSRYRQGRALADFLLCRNCGVLVAVLFEDAGEIFAVVNAKTVDGGVTFGPEQRISPKMLSDAEKVARWRSIWFPNVRLVV